MLLVVFLVVFLYFLFTGTPKGTKPRPPTQPSAPPKRSAPSNGGGAGYVRKNLAHLPPQRSARATPEKASIDPSIYLHSDKWDELLVPDDQGMPNLYLQRHSDELWLTEATTGLLVNVGNRRLRRMGIWTVKVRGVNYHEAAVRRGAFQPGAPVRLLREPGNEYDKNAVAVYAAEADEQCGYFNKAMAAGMAKVIDSGAPLHAISLAGGSPGALTEHGLNIKVLAASPEIVAHLFRRRPI
ncbi:HIRAN domain-containing protein [Cryobacterium lyxosi]|uniref:HIRAN domain-containing protein n=1 Tax=Cryobacterium lyxosi TaxID=1259228 RepID=UPI00141BE180|nr:HIRAN domain-containing protein [Cryobacterium lyxosi]